MLQVIVIRLQCTLHVRMSRFGGRVYLQLDVISVALELCGSSSDSGSLLQRIYACQPRNCLFTPVHRGNTHLYNCESFLAYILRTPQPFVNA